MNSNQKENQNLSSTDSESQEEIEIDSDDKIIITEEDETKILNESQNFDNQVHEKLHKYFSLQLKEEKKEKENEDEDDEKENDPYAIPRFIINLDEPPETRWHEVVEKYKSCYKEVLEFLDGMIKEIFGSGLIGKFMKKIANSIFGSIAKSGAVFFGKELQAIAKQSKFPLGSLLLLNIAYELSAACTSIVTQRSDDNKFVLARTMDWEMPFLKKFTIEIDFRRNGETVFIGTTWPGYAGILTGMKPGVAAVSVNYRVTGGSVLKNLMTAKDGAWPVGFLVRHLLTSDYSYDEIVGGLSKSFLMAPVYLTVCGVSDATLITREREDEVKKSRWTFSKKGLIIQCNQDHWRNDSDSDVFMSRKRKKAAKKILAEMEEKDLINNDTLWALLYTPPLTNDITIYYTVCCPDDGYYKSRIAI
ncbi:acid amidase [Anaeramoeba ignava]|uniref:Acid amidase n=1 Tax=Anaeramoeba ignava TaxID=1746090 RepID=A0A9Q0LUX6_ANAIG|nr:acid amidase [Anaeramoeba ignava]